MIKNKKNLIKLFKKNWEKVNDFEKKELSRMTMSEKFQQLNSLICLGVGMNLKKDKKESEVRARWVDLKKRMK